MDLQKSQEETLREAACIGDIESVQSLLTQGVNPNSQNVINGWTALHWAAKRGNKDIAQALLDCGADSNIANQKGEVAANLTTDPSLLQLLGGNVISDAAVASSQKDDSSFTPHYLSHPPLIPKINQTPKPQTNPLPPAVMNKPFGTNCFAQTGESNELVVKVRVANSPDPDFIEVEVSEPTFSGLLRVCCEELGVPAQRVARVRKLPNTVVRKDKDVQRFHFLQEIELILEGEAVFQQNGSVPQTKSNCTNCYQSISKYKNQTILY